MDSKFVVLLFGAALQLGAAAAVPLLSECDAAATVKANVAKDADVKVISSLSGGADCFQVLAQVDGKQTRGYVIGRDLDAIVAYEKERVEFLRGAMSRPPAIETPPPPPAPAAAEANPASKPEAATKEQEKVDGVGAAPAAPKRRAAIPN